MRNLIYFFVLISVVTINSCKKDCDGCASVNANKDSINLGKGLVVYIPFNTSILDTISKKIGINYHSIPDEDHKTDVNQGLGAASRYFSASQSSHIDFGDLDSASFTNNIFSISCWVRISDTSSKMAIISKREVNGPFEYSLDNHFSLSLLKFDNWIADASGPVYGIDPLNASTPFLPDGKWHFVAFIADGEKMSSYFDGKLQTTTDLKKNTGSFINSAARLIIGNGGGFGRNYYFTGSVDDIRMYNRVLNLTELNQLFVNY